MKKFGKHIRSKLSRRIFDLKKHPIIPIFITNLEYDIPSYYLYHSLVEQHKVTECYKIGHSFPIENVDKNILNGLYFRFLYKAQKILGPFNLSEKNITTCWAYMTNKDHYMGGIHNHVRSSTINGVYYLNVPHTEDEKEGIITFFDDNDKELFWYKPRKGDLVIMPNFMKHEPKPISTEEYRVAINMEILCDYVW